MRRHSTKTKTVCSDKDTQSRSNILSVRLWSLTTHQEFSGNFADRYYAQRNGTGRFKQRVSAKERRGRQSFPRNHRVSERKRRKKNHRGRYLRNVALQPIVSFQAVQGGYGGYDNVVFLPTENRTGEGVVTQQKFERYADCRIAFIRRARLFFQNVQKIYAYYAVCLRKNSPQPVGAMARKNK